MSRGNRVVLSYAPQADITQIPKTGWKILPFKSNSLNNTVELTDSETIVNSRIKTAGMVTSATAEGDVEVEFIKSIYDDLIAAAAFNTWNNNSLLFGGSTQQLFAIEEMFGDVTQYHYWAGMAVNRWVLTIPTSGFISMTFGFVGQDYKTATEAYAVTPASVATAPKASSISVESITIDNENLRGIACVTDFNFELDNGMERQNCIGSGLYGAKNLEKQANMSGSLTLAYGQKAQSILDKQLTGATVAIQATIKFPDGARYTLGIPKAQLSGDIPNGGANDLLSAQLRYTVVEQAPTLTRAVVA
ncbi:hypothetical protein A9308_00575 [Moraxella atlantae]|uniref:Phage tail protein n=1 Tax=Faucicola atlantae TaxID=34059 RepID=A0A1B8Q8Y3_9GAMM|nr:phage tail tube protein [Moraxella atlantae]OBX73738.1 hypothetical protein A9308_00575 [Moraxella atlantae]